VVRKKEDEKDILKIAAGIRPVLIAKFLLG
jgi:hypothetical protein